MTSAQDIAMVTGAAGFIGSNIARELAREGRRVVVCDKFDSEDTWKYLEPALVHDIIAPGQVHGWLARHADAVGLIVHMGAVSATTERDLPKIIENNVRLTIDLWEFACANSVDFVYASSAATYGDGARGFVDDDSPSELAKLHPLNPYGWSKHLVDRRIVDDVRRGVDAPRRWAGLKFFNVYGPNEGHKGSMRSVIHQIYPSAANNKPVKLFKSNRPDYQDGGQRRDFIYVKDCVSVVQNILAAEKCSGIYNVGTGHARSFADLAAAVFSAVGNEANIEYIEMPEDLRGRYQYFTEADTSKLRAAGLAPAFHSLEDGVREYVTSHLAHELG